MLNKPKRPRSLRRIIVQDVGESLTKLEANLKRGHQEFIDELVEIFINQYGLTPEQAEERARENVRKMHAGTMRRAVEHATKKANAIFN